MRRADRQVLDTGRIMEIIESAQVCRLALNTGAAPYIVPLNFGYELAGEKLTLYFHCAQEGRKLDLIQKDPAVGFEMDVMSEILKGDAPCKYSCGYKSVTGFGKASIIDDMDEKTEAFIKIMRHISKRDFEKDAFDKATMEKTGVIKLEVIQYTAKEKQK